MIDDKVAKMAANTIKMYCQQVDNCGTCAMQENCLISLEARCDRFPISMIRCFPRMNLYMDVGSFTNRDISKTPKFDVAQKDSADFRKYINEIFLREAEKYELPINTANSIKWFENGKIQVTFVDDDNKTNYIGVAKCHPNDAFNPEIGIKLAIERAGQMMHAMNDMNKYERTIPKAGEKWMHFKGHVYKIIGFGNHTERMELVVIYQEAGDCTYWVRPLEKFMSKVDHNKYPDVPYKWRFWKVSDAEQ